MAKKKSDKIKQYCPQCKKDKNEIDFYKVVGNENRNHRALYCKECIKDRAYFTTSRFKIDITEFQEILRGMDIPFIANAFLNAESGTTETIGRYMSKIKLGQYKGLTWKDSIFVDDKKKNEYMLKELVTRTDLDEEEKEGNLKTSYVTIFDGYTTTYEYLRHKYGRKFDDIETADFERAYFKIRKGYSSSTEADEENLINASIAHVNMRNAMADKKGNKKNISDWANIYNSSIKNLNKIDYTSKLGSYSMLMKALEESEDVVTIFPNFLETPRDDIDMILYSHVFKDRELLGLDTSNMKYGDMYKFYEKLKDDFEKDKKATLINKVNYELLDIRD